MRWTRRSFLKSLSLFLGWNANQQPLRLSPEDRAAHMYVVGSSGSGKSKFLEHLVREDIRNHQPLMLVDPHGELYDNVVSWCGYKGYSASRDIVLLNLSRGDQVTGFNPFARSPGVDVSVQVERRILATVKSWGVEDTDTTPTLERMLRLVYTSIIEKDATILEAGGLINFHADEVTRYLTTGLGSELIAREWRELRELKTSRQWRDEVLSVKNRLLRFLCSERTRRFMGLTHNNLDLGDIISNRKTLLVNLAESDQLSGVNARLFGSLLTNQLFEEAKRRRQDERSRPPAPFRFYLDEFHLFTPFDLSDMLDQVRKRGVFLTMAHQRFGQLDDDILDAVLTNTRIKAVFGGLSRPTAQRLVEELFVDQLDLKEIRKAIYQTKFWPTYARDKVYVDNWGESSGTMQSSGMSLNSGMAQADGAGWFDSGVTTRTSSSASVTSNGASSSSSSGGATIDIPIFIPVPFTELSSLEYWSREDQIWRMSDALMNQFPRHCFIKIHTQKTQPMLVPFVRSYFLSPRNLVRYTSQLYAKQGALPRAEVDRLIEERQTRLLSEAREANLLELQEDDLLQETDPTSEPSCEEKPKLKRLRRPKHNPIKDALKNFRAPPSES